MNRERQSSAGDEEIKKGVTHCLKCSNPLEGENKGGFCYRCKPEGTIIGVSGGEVHTKKEVDEWQKKGAKKSDIEQQ